jgi:ubiquinone/menaquinone biosynthesis C-methylase UbiE
MDTIRSSCQTHLERIRERFTRTAEPFAETVKARGQQVEAFAAMATTGYLAVSAATVLDVCCGPGTFGRAFAPLVARVLGLDFTPAMIAKARSIAGDAHLANMVFACGDGNALPFADGTFDLALCTYAFHHLPEPVRVLGQMVRVVRKGGRVAVVDAVMPERADKSLNTRIEKLRDASHAAMLSEKELRELFQSAGLRVIASSLNSRERDFDDWMYGAGWAPGTPAYVEVRREIEATLARDTAGFAPKLDPKSGALTVTQTALSLIAEK